jgi:hypothetical protein
LRGFSLLSTWQASRCGRPGGLRGTAPPAHQRQTPRFADETLLVMLHGLLCWLAARRVPLARLEFAHPQPAHADEYRRMFSPDLRFDRPITAIAFDAQVLRAPVSVSEGSLKAFLRDAPQSVFLKQVVPTRPGRRARRLCRAALDQGLPAPTLTEFAEVLARPLPLAPPARCRRRSLGPAEGRRAA